MLTRRVVFVATLALLAFGLPPTSQAADQSAKQFIEAIYKTYVGKDSKGMPIDKPQTQRLFTPALAKLIKADAARAAKRKEVGNIDGDVFIDAQDWDIKSFTVNVTQAGADKATGKVTVKNFDKDAVVTLDLVKLKDGWHIDDIRYADRTLRKMLKGS